MDVDDEDEHTPLMVDEADHASFYADTPTRRDDPLSIQTYVLFLIFGVGAAWMVEDGMWIELSYFQQHQPEGTTLSNKMTVAEAMVAVLIVPFYIFLDDKINYRQFMYIILTLETVSCLLAAFLWHLTVDDLSIMIYVVMFITSFVGHLNWIVVQPYFTGTNNRLAAVICVACNTGSVQSDFVDVFGSNLCIA